MNVLAIVKEAMKEIKANMERLGFVFVFSSDGTEALPLFFEWCI